jgi:hypothetical protein
VALHAAKVRNSENCSKTRCNVEALLNLNVARARTHALPFRVIFEEARRCRPQRLYEAVAKMLSKTDPASLTRADVDALLLAALTAHEKAYDALEVNAERIVNGDPDAPRVVDGLLKACADADRPLKWILHAMDASALCLSGGGIRSASFGLGLMEALARFSCNGGTADGLLNRIDYLSTVSGGGYIGSWMMAWVYRRWAAASSETCKSSFQEVVLRLAGQSDVTGGDPEPQPVRHLRSYTSFLAPALGLTLDTFTLVAIVLRNLVVNWVMLLPVLFAVAALAQTSGYLLISMRDWLADGKSHDLFRMALGLIFAMAAFAAGEALPSHRLSRAKSGWRIVCGIAFRIMVPLGCWILAIFPARNCPSVRVLCGASCVLNLQQLYPALATALVGYGILSLYIWSAYRGRVDQMLAKGVSGPNFWRRKSTVGFLLMLAAAGAALLASVLLSLVQQEIFSSLLKPSAEWNWINTYVGRDGLFATFSVPLVVAVLMLTTVLFCAVIGLFEQEEDREWWARMGGALLQFSLAWVVVHGLLFFGPTVWHRFWVATGGLLLGFGGSLAGYSGATSAGTRPVKSAELGTVGKFLQKHNMVLPVVGGTAILLILLGAMTFAQRWNLELRGVLDCRLHWQWARDMHSHGWHAGLGSAVLLLVVCLALMVLANLAININLFSLHGMYRMRLMRAFLGASNVARRPDKFTNFDPNDTPLEIELPSEEGVPLHLICTTLNLVGTRKTAWMQRRAESFTFSPIVAGGWRVGYAPAGIYGGTRGVSLATALSISGAAFNPNMGYQSSPLLSLLMTFFNMRLGCWLPNPKRPTSKSGLGKSDAAFLSKSGPSFALKPLLQEALGQTNDTNRWIELTDGGHFENLALYEMVMRRCKFIIVSDAGADPKCEFEDLGNAIRKIQIDLGVPIVFPKGLKMKAGFEDSNRYCAVGRIEYQWADDPGPGQKTEDLVGCLIYIKPGLNGSEPIDVQQYAKVHSTFPHETTANQFFDEPQFESYRNLAFHEVTSIVNLAGAESSEGFTLDDFLKLARTYAQ